MGKTKILFGILSSLLLLIAILHTVFHFAVAGTGISSFYGQGISGFSIGKITLGEEFKTQYKSFSPISLGIIAGEWCLFFTFLIFTSVKKRIDAKREVLAIHINKHSDKSKTKTDLDYLYETLKEKKSLKISTIAEAFKIDKDLAEQWCKTLEEGNLATMNYPRMGEPELVLIE